ncbi:hypothetical protein [uncultured Clostridium sp.]|nr:hypothetical protein [uncultured Clostridium sp.]
MLAITVLDTCYRVYLGAVLGTVMFLVCVFVFFKGIQGVRFLNDNK